MPQAPSIRVATPSDAARLLEIYTPYVVDTAITFEYEPPALEEFRGRIERTLERYPYLVAERADAAGGTRVVGYVYASPFKSRPAYDWAVETSIYVDRAERGHGVGRALHDALKRALAAMGVLNMEACIATTEAEDEHLTNASRDFHAHLGYRLVGEFERCGFKFNRWYNMVWMELLIGEHGSHQQPIRPFPTIVDDVVPR